MRRLWRRGASYQVLQRLDVNNSSDLSLASLASVQLQLGFSLIPVKCGNVMREITNGLGILVGFEHFHSNEDGDDNDDENGEADGDDDDDTDDAKGW